MKLQIVIDLELNENINKCDILSQLMPATKKFEEYLPHITSAELTQILLPTDKIIKNPKILEIDSVKLNIENRSVTVNENIIQITPLEFKLLYTLMSKRGQVQSRESLLNDVWGINPNNNTRTVDIHIKRIRDKLGNKIIHTVSGIGYVIR